MANGVSKAAFLELDLSATPLVCDFFVALFLSLYNTGACLLKYDKSLLFLKFFFKILLCKNSRNGMRWAR